MPVEMITIFERQLSSSTMARLQQLCHQPPNDWRRLNTSILRSGRSEMAVLLTFRLLCVGSIQAGKSRFALIRVFVFLQNRLSVKIHLSTGIILPSYSTNEGTGGS
jgi:hypothetical protein